MELWIALIVAVSAILTGPIATAVVAWVTYRIRRREAIDLAMITNSKLDVIHTLVNSNMTAAMQAELDATVRELALMREVIALKSEHGRDPSADALAAIESTTKKIAELRAVLADRAQPKKEVT